MDDYISPSTLKQEKCTTASVTYVSEGDDSKSSVSSNNQNIEDTDDKDSCRGWEEIVSENGYQPQTSIQCQEVQGPHNLILKFNVQVRNTSLSSDTVWQMVPCCLACDVCPSEKIIVDITMN